MTCKNNVSTCFNCSLVSKESKQMKNESYLFKTNTVCLPYVHQKLNFDCHETEVLCNCQALGPGLVCVCVIHFCQVISLVNNIKI